VLLLKNGTISLFEKFSPSHFCFAAKPWSPTRQGHHYCQRVALAAADSGAAVSEMHPYHSEHILGALADKFLSEQDAALRNFRHLCSQTDNTLIK
jgi:hypothetical protein